MSNMTANTKLEIIKSLAYGMSPEEIADVNDGVSVSSIKKIAAEEATEVEAERNYLVEMGMMK